MSALSPDLHEQHVCCVKPGKCRDEHFHERDVVRIIQAEIARALEGIAHDPTLRLSGHSGISVKRVLARADEIREAAR